MKVKKWSVSIATFAVMAVMMVLCAVCAGAEAYGNFEYGVLDDGTVEITGYKGSEQKVDVPEKINKKSVTRIGNLAFKDCTKITSIAMPDSVAYIGRSAFYNCTSLKSITIPDGVKEIGYAAFSECAGLVSVKIPDNVTKIGDSAFINCANLTKIDVTAGNKYYSSANGVLFNKDKSELICYPAGIKNVGYSIPDGVTVIRDRAFNKCLSLNSITIPKSVQDIETYSFFGCTSLEAINVAASNKNYADVNGILFSKDKTKIVCYPANKKNMSYSIPVSVKVVGVAAFRDCIYLKGITIPDSVTNIEHHAFSNCKSLKSITIPDSITAIEMATFIDCASLTGVKIPDSVTSIRSGAFSNCTSLTKITIPAGVKTIADSALGYCYDDNGNKKKTGLKIYCYSNTQAEAYAKSGKFSYVLLDKLPAFAKVTGFKVKSKTNVSANLQWNKNISADGYVLDKYDGSKWVTIKTFTSNANTSFNVTGLKASTTFKFRIKAYKMYDITTVYSAFTYLNVNTRPYTTTGMKCSSKTNVSANLRWNKNISANGYVLDKYDGKKWVTIKTFTSNTNTSFNVTGLKASTTFKFRLRAYKNFGSVKEYSAFTYLNVNTRPYTTTGMKCSSKTNVSANLQWNKNRSADGYVLDKYDGKKWVTIKTFTSNANTSFNVTGLKASTTFKFRLRAYKNFGSVKEYSAFTYLNVNTRPYTTTGMKCSSKTNVSANLQWNKNRSADGYVLDKYDGKKWVTIKTFTSNANTSFNVTGLKASTTFKFRLRAYKNFGSVKEYSAFTYLNVNTRPYTTTGFKMKSATKNAITLQWNKNISASGYCIEKWNGSKWVQIKRYTSNANVTYTATGLKANTAYKFRIRAYKTIGNVNEYSAYSAVVTARTQK